MERIEVRRYIHAKPDAIWETLTRPEKIYGWFEARATLETKQGGSFSFMWEHGCPESGTPGPIEWKGTVTAYEANRRMVLKTSKDDKHAPDAECTIELHAHGDRTELSIVDNVPEPKDPTMSSPAKMRCGWNQCAESIRSLVETGRYEYGQLDPQKVREGVAALEGRWLTTTYTFLKDKVGPKGFEEYTEYFARQQAQVLKTQGVTTPLGLALYLARQDAGLYGDPIDVWGSQDKSTLERPLVRAFQAARGLPGAIDMKTFQTIYGNYYVQLARAMGFSGEAQPAGEGFVLKFSR